MPFFTCAVARPLPVVDGEVAHGGRMSQYLGLAIHVSTNHGNPYNYFSDPNNEASSNFWVADALSPGRNDGDIEQFVDSDYAAWAQANGNYTYASVETSGMPEQGMSAAMIESVAKIYAEGHVRHGWPFQITDTPGVPGLGWHGMGASVGWGHPQCPGEIRKSQRGAILARAQEIVNGGEDMSQADVDQIKSLLQQVSGKVDQIENTAQAALNASAAAGAKADATGLKVDAIRAGGGLIRVDGTIDTSPGADPIEASGDPTTHRAYAVWDVDQTRNLKFPVTPDYAFNEGSDLQVPIRRVTAGYLRSVPTWVDPLATSSGHPTVAA